MPALPKPSVSQWSDNGSRHCCQSSEAVEHCSHSTSTSSGCSAWSRTEGLQPSDRPGAPAPQPCLCPLAAAAMSTCRPRSGGQLCRWPPSQRSEGQSCRCRPATRSLHATTWDSSPRWQTIGCAKGKALGFQVGCRRFTCHCYRRLGVRSCNCCTATLQVYIATVLVLAATTLVRGC